MDLIKINATESSNSYLKDLSRKTVLENFTVVLAHEQYKGRGQMATVWESEAGKNLTCSILIKWERLNISRNFYISKIVSLSIVHCLDIIFEANLAIKWPNDIMAAGHKLAGILIENSVKKTKVVQSVIGIGLNVNQIKFKDLPGATSMKIISNKEFDVEVILTKLIEKLNFFVELLKNQEFKLIDTMYINHLYKIQQPVMFKDSLGELFIGKIIGVSQVGKLRIQLENETVNEFDLKQVSFAQINKE
jgi:BirA family biotin operon repressor/biotin-[acetyl-CoA-carboxylase] ligase